jgi:hypothetical protein
MPNLKVKGKLSLYLTNYAVCHEDVWGSGCTDPHFLDLSTSWWWVVSFTPRPLYPRERAHSTHCIGGWVDSRAGLDDTEKLKFPTLPGLELWPLCRTAHSQLLYRLHFQPLKGMEGQLFSATNLECKTCQLLWHLLRNKRLNLTWWLYLRCTVKGLVCS